MKNKVIYESQIHIRDKSHDVLVIQEPKVNGVKLKMTYECYNAVERFTGELFVGGKWEHFFSILDLGIESDKSNYVRSEEFRKTRATELRELGIKFFNSIHK
jgi:NACalpha-BTF3-like transcription factor